MSVPDLTLTGADVLRPDGVETAAALSLAQGQIADGPAGRQVDLSGYMILPGIIDIHGDGFERHLAPRRGAMKDIDHGLIAAEAELAANGISTAVLAQFYSWEGGMRGPEFAERVFAGVAKIRDDVVTDLHMQLRFETSMLNFYEEIAGFVARHDVAYMVFNDHLPHEMLARGKTPPGLVGKALRIGCNPDKHLAMMQDMHARMGEVPGAVAGLVARLLMQGVRMGSHDDRDAAGRAVWRDMGVRIAEFPETPEAIEAARANGDPVIMGAPNVVRGGSHKGNVSAAEMVIMGQVDALASDYHYPSLRRAAFLMTDSGVADLVTAWALISKGPARVLGLTDRGEIAPGLRADLLIMDPGTRRVAATFAGGQISYMTGEVAARFAG